MVGKVGSAVEEQSVKACLCQVHVETETQTKERTGPKAPLQGFAHILATAGDPYGWGIVITGEVAGDVVSSSGGCWWGALMDRKGLLLLL